MKKINYGIDAPKVIRNMLLIGIILILLSIPLLLNLFPSIFYLKYSFLSTAACLILSSILMLLYSRFGKMKHRDRILNMHEWRGNEKVLDVGTGSGLLMIGAAKKLTTGKSYGIDIFNSYDLSDNTMEHTQNNIRLEGVADKTELLSENILKTNFADNYFDVIVSNLCLRNIYNANGRKQACTEIFRILKPGGKTIISDFKHTGEYKKNFQELGMNTKKSGPFLFDTYPPLTIISATKPVEIHKSDS